MTPYGFISLILYTMHAYVEIEDILLDRNVRFLLNQLAYLIGELNNGVMYMALVKKCYVEDK